MNTKRTLSFVAAALVAGLVIGNMASAIAARQTQDNPRAQAATRGCDGERMGLGVGMRGTGARPCDVVADLTSLSAEDVAAKRAEGTSLTDIASEAGVDIADVVDTAIDTRKTALAEKVASGAITQEQADAVTERMRERITERVESTDPCGSGSGCGEGRGCDNGGGRGFGGGKGRGMGPGAGAGACGGAGGACGGGACTPPTQ